MKINVRPSKPDDEKQLKELHRLLNGEFKNSIVPEELGKYLEFTDLEGAVEYSVNVEGHMAEWQALVAESGDGLFAGCLVGTIHRHPYFKRGKYGMIESFYVREEFRGKGIGTALYQRIEEWFMNMGCKDARVSTWAFNSLALEFYEHAGFKVLSKTLVKDIS